MAIIAGKGTISLTASISQPSIARLDVLSVRLNDRDSTAQVVIAANSSVGNARAVVFELQIANGSCQGLRAKAAPSGWDDAMEIFPLAIATGYTDLEASYTGANIATKMRSVMTWAQGAGVLPAGTVS